VNMEEHIIETVSIWMKHTDYHIQMYM